jgi:peptide/nickel transport system substrate-binding protein
MVLVPGRKSRTLGVAAALGLAAALTLAAAATVSARDEATPRSSITIAQSASVDAMEPDIEPARSSIRIDEEVLEAATRYVAPRGGIPTIAPGLAKSWRQISPKVWQFKLRPNVKFTNGEPLTASVFKNSLDIYRANKAAGAFVFSNVEIKVIDNLTFNVTTKTANFGALPSAMTFLFAYPPKYYKQVGKTGFGNAPVGTGPYVLKSFKHGIGITLEANSNYWGARPAIKTLNFSFVPDPATRVAMLQTGKADIIADMPPSLASRIQGLKSASVKALESQRRIFFFFNNFTDPTDNVLVRQAINYAVNKDSLIKNLFGGRAYPLHGIFIPGELGYDAKFKGYPYNPAKAKELLAKAGHSGGLSVKMYYTINSTVLDRETALAIAGMLQQVGIKPQLIGGTENAQEAVYDPGKMDGMGGWSYGPIYDDSYFLTNVASFSTGSLYGGYSKDATTDKLTAAAVGTTNKAKRQRLYQQVQRHVIMNKADWVPLYALQDIYGVNKCLTWQPRADQNYGLEAAKTTC